MEDLRVVIQQKAIQKRQGVDLHVGATIFIAMETNVKKFTNYYTIAVNVMSVELHETELHERG